MISVKATKTERDAKILALVEEQLRAWTLEPSKAEIARALLYLIADYKKRLPSSITVVRHELLKENADGD